MQVVHLKLKGDEAWPELVDYNVKELDSQEVQVAFLDNGTQNGQPVVIFRLDEDGTAYTFQLTGNNFMLIASAYKGKYEDKK